jgi:hypothetical protein
MNREGFRADLRKLICTYAEEQDDVHGCDFFHDYFYECVAALEAHRDDNPKGKANKLSEIFHQPFGEFGSLGGADL